MRMSDWSSDVCSSYLRYGREIGLQATYKPVFGADGTPRKVVKIATDITRQVRQEREARHRLADSHRLQHDLERQKNALEKTMNQLADIVSTIRGLAAQTNILALRSDARRVGQEGDSTCSSRWWPYH